MQISDWLDEKVKEGVDVSQITLPTDIVFDEVADELVFFKEINPCGAFCTKNHPYAKVERFGHWYRCKGQDKEAGIHASGMKWLLFTRSKDRAIQAAKAHIE